MRILPYVVTALDFGKRRPAIARLLRGMLKPKADALGYEFDDFVQDTILRAWARQGTTVAFDPNRASWETWMVRVANDTLRTAYKRKVKADKLSAALGPHHARLHHHDEESP